MFVSFEGIDGAGKSTQARMLAAALGEGTVLVREPGGTPAGERIRELLKDPELELTPRAELMLFLAARAELVETVIKPALAAGRDVVCDRFLDSTVAYQGAARGLGVELVSTLNDVAIAGCVPDRTVLLVLDGGEAVGARRRARRLGQPTASSARATSSAIASRRPSTALARAEPERIVVVDGSGEPDAVHAKVLEALGISASRAWAAPAATFAGAARCRRRGRSIGQTETDGRRPPRDARVRDRAPALGPGRDLAQRSARARLTPTPSSARPGSGKGDAARAFAAELLSRGSDDPDQARRRGLADPSPHPDLAWLRPPGNQHLVDEVRERVIAQVSYRPFEGETRVFVIEDADAMAEESQNALLKTLEEPPPYAHLILVSAEPEALLETVRSRCQEITFRSLPARGRRAAAGRVRRRAAGDDRRAGGARRRRCRARPLPRRRARRPLRELTEECCRAARAGDVSARPWGAVLKLAAEIGKEEGESVAASGERTGRADRQGPRRRPDPQGRRRCREARRSPRPHRLDRPGAGADRLLVRRPDRRRRGRPGADPQPRSQRRAEPRPPPISTPALARRAAELAMETRRRLQVNVSEELALEALFHRIAASFA